MEDTKRMGELFQLNRSKKEGGSINAERRNTDSFARGDSNSNRTAGGNNGGGGQPTMMEIQREQELEKAAASRNNNNRFTPNKRNSNRHGGGGGGGNDRYGSNDRSYGGGGGYGGGNDRHGGNGGNDRYGGTNDRYGSNDRYDNDYNRGGGPSRGGGGGGYQDREYERNDRGRRRGNAPPRGPNLDELPIETGKIHTLLDNFGFIYCADRPGELFFHYSQVGGVNPNDLKCDMEVQFHVGPSQQRGGGSRNDDTGGEKLSGYAVSVLEPGTVKWDVEEEPGVRKQGTIDRLSRRMAKGYTEGTIRLKVMEDVGDDDNGNSLPQEETEEMLQDTKSPKKKKKNRPMVVRYNENDIKDKGSSHGLDQGDLVEFTLVTEKRSGRKFARDLVLIQSERKRLEEEREAKLLENATLEQGVVVTLKDGFGFLKSNRSKGEIYFHYSHVCLPEDGEEHELREGQDMEFLVVRETGKNRLSARQINFLEKGSVVFQQVLATGVTGTVTLCPCPPAQPNIFASRGRRKPKPMEATMGKVALSKSIAFHPVENEDSSIEVLEVALRSEDCPGGILSLNRDGSKVGLWIREGDLISFDVVRDVVDGTCFVTPTKSSARKVEENQVEKLQVRLLSPSLAGRAEGVVTAIKDNFGFIQLADRAADIYFRLNDVFPDEIHEDLGAYSYDSKDQLEETKYESPKLTIGSHVTFDLSLQEPQGPSNDSRNRNTRYRSDKDQMRAQRLAILSEPTILLTKAIGTNVKGKVTKIHSMNGFSGLIELDDSVKGMTPEERHPIIAKLIETLASSDVGNSIKFHDVQSERELRTIQNFIDDNDTLDLSMVPSSEGERHSGLISIQKVDICSRSRDLIKNEAVDTEDAPQSPEKGVGRELESITDSREKSLTSEVVSESSEKEGDEEGMKSSGKRKRRKQRAVRMMKFDKQSLSSDLLKQPLGVGDIVSCDIMFIRRTNAFSVSNIQVMERKDRELVNPDLVGAVKHTCQGYILMAPSHTSLSHTPSHAVEKRSSTTNDQGRWGQFTKEGKGKTIGTSKEEGLILMLQEPNTDDTIKPTSEASESNERIEENAENAVKTFTCISYINSSTVGRSEGSDTPKRCDLVCFSKNKGGKARDIRILKRGAIEVCKGRLEGIDIECNSAKFLTPSDEYTISLSDVISCDKTLLKENENVEGILYEGKIYGGKTMPFFIL
jgi:cold shock CspA family protein